MKIHLILLSFLFVFSGLNAQTVTVTNVEQDGQKLVVSYDIIGGTGNYEVSLFCSTDDGTTWAGPLKSLIGDVGKNIVVGVGKKITWTVLNDRADLKSDQVRFKVKASKVEGTVTDIDGNVYQTVKIGTQIWMKENLKVSHYRNGDSLLMNLSNEQWQRNYGRGACASYRFESKFGKGWNKVYGKLYNWYAVVDDRELCPVGWHVPSEGEWKDLEEFLGGAKIAGGKMKDTISWLAPNKDASNLSDFLGKPGGYRNVAGVFCEVNNISGYWWTSTEMHNDAAYYRLLRFDYGDSYSDAKSKENGLSVRCIKN